MYKSSTMLILFILLSWTLLTAQNSTVDLTELSLEDLMNVEVTLPSRKAEKLSKSTAAIFVLTHEDIERSGALCLPDLLRLIPGIQVSQLDANKWGISSRGGNSILANKLLVLIDGRSVYTPVFSGVTWESQDLLLENIDRIEVIRGPGGSLWGANAVNGVINIITKQAKETQGTTITTGTGTHNKIMTSIIQGGRIDQNSYYQLYFKTHHRDMFELGNGQDAYDQWHMNRIGFQVDLESFSNSALNFQGSIFDGKANQTLDTSGMWTEIFQHPKNQIKNRGGYVMAQFNHQISRYSEMTAQLSYDRLERIDYNLLGGKYDQIDFDFQHQKVINWKHTLLWGGGYRWIQDKIDSTGLGYFIPASRKYQVINAFIQDHIQINRDIFRLTIGSKFEYNDFSGFEIQPSFRGLYTPNEEMTTWFAVSRAVRTPSRGDHDFSVIYQQSDTMHVQLRGTDTFQAEQVIAYELGQRWYPDKKLSIDITAFLMRYNNLRSFEPKWTDTYYAAEHPDIRIRPFDAENNLKTTTTGVELVSDAYIIPNWRLRSSYSFLNLDVDLSSSANLIADKSRGQNAQHKAYLWNSWEMNEQITADAIVRFVGKLTALNIPDYVTGDVQISWHPNNHFNLTLIGRNLFENLHIEHKELLIAIVPSYIERSVYGAIEWRF